MSNTENTTHFGNKTILKELKSEMVGEVFTNVAKKYDLMNDVMSLGIHRIWKTALIDWLSPKNGQELLDVAGGTGDIAFRLLKRAPKSRVTVLDMTEKMLVEGKRRAEAHKFKENIDWICADAMKLPFKENSFDVVICNHVLEHVEDYKKVMSELCRVMKVGSWGIFQVPIDINNPITMEENITSPEERERIYGQKDHLRLFGQDYSKKLAAAGFKVTEVDFIKELSPKQVERYALPKDEIIYFCEK